MLPGAIKSTQPAVSGQTKQASCAMCVHPCRKQNKPTSATAAIDTVVLSLAHLLADLYLYSRRCAANAWLILLPIAPVVLQCVHLGGMVPPTTTQSKPPATSALEAGQCPLTGQRQHRTASPALPAANPMRFTASVVSTCQCCPVCHLYDAPWPGRPVLLLQWGANQH